MFARFPPVLPIFLLLGLAFSPWELPAAEPLRITVGSKAFTESVILGELLSHLARHSGAEVEHKSEMGTRVVFEALKAGEVDLYPEYTGTLSAELLSDVTIRDDDDLHQALAKLGLKMSGRLGFNNTYALGLKRTLAESLQLKTITDLQRPEDAVRKLRIAFSDEFVKRKDGWLGLKEKYRLPHDAIGMNHSLAYQGIEKGAIDVTDLFSTDAEIRSYDLLVLEDNLGYFPVYHAVFLYRADLEQRAPEVVAAIRKLEGAIDNQTMIEMNASSRIDRRSETRVAAEFLQNKLQLPIPLPADDYWGRLARDVARTTWEHLVLVLVSLAAAVVIAVPLGIVAAKTRWLGQVILAVVGMVQTIPSLALLVLFIPLFGLGFVPAVCALFLYSLLPIVRGTYAGLKEISGNLLESAEVLGLPAAARLRLIELPLASRSILSGVKTAAIINVGTATIGGLIGAGGYGQPINTGIRLYDISLLLQGALPAVALALAAQGLFEFAERWFVPAGLRKLK